MTHRERQVASMTAQGMSQKAIAAKLGIHDRKPCTPRLCAVWLAERHH